MEKHPYRVWHIAQIPSPAFYVEVPTLEEAARLADALADYDLHQLEHNIKPDYANMNGIEQWNVEDGQWEEVDDYELETVLESSHE